MMNSEQEDEEAAGIRHELNESICNASIDSIVAIDSELKIISWNDTAQKWTGKQREDAIGRSFFEVFPTATTLPGLKNALQRALQGYKSFLPPMPGFYMSGHYEMHIVPLKDKSGTVHGVLQILHDVAHRIKIENELLRLNRELTHQYTALEHANEELTTFAKIASQDLKEPLRKIYTFTELIMVHEAGKLSTSGRTNFRRIQKSVQRMGLLTDDIVNFTNLSRKEERQQLDLNELLKEELEQLHQQISQANAIIEYDILPIVTGYRMAMVQLFRQLLSNALKFHKSTAAPEIKISATQIPGKEIASLAADPEQEYTCIAITDNGIGFEPQYSRLIFDMFHRLHQNNPFKGTGMGLAIAQKAVRLHDGFIIAESIPGTGSTFYCYLPLE